MWLDRTVVLAYAVMAGLAVVAFTLMTNKAFAWFEQIYHFQGGWIVLFWTPALAAVIVWGTRRFAPTAAGSGIPQVMAALESDVTPEQRQHFVSLRLTAAKMVLGSAGFLGGMSIGREGPSVQIAAGVMQHARRWLRPQSGISDHALLVAGGAAGIAAAFNAPLAGVVFAIEELSRKLESRSSGLLITGIVLAGLIGVSFFGNRSYFGVIQVPELDWNALVPGLMVTLACGALGGLFSKLMAASLTGSPERMNLLRARFPVRFAAVGGLVIAVIGLVTGGATFGAGSEEVQHILAGQADMPELYVTLKFIATWLTAWCGVPGGIFAPSLSIGAGVGQNVSLLMGSDIAPALIAMGMAAFLAAVTQAPLTAFIIVMEMIDGHAMVLSLMSAAMLASLISRLIARPLYETLAMHMVAVLHKSAAAAGPAAAPPTEPPSASLQPVPDSPNDPAAPTTDDAPARELPGTAPPPEPPEPPEPPPARPRGPDGDRQD